MSTALESALSRPLHYSVSGAQRQWEMDKSLGILDWDPTPEEAEEYVRRRKEMGDPSYALKKEPPKPIRFDVIKFGEAGKNDLISCDATFNEDNAPGIAAALNEGSVPEDNYCWFTKDAYVYAPHSIPVLRKLKEKNP